MPPSIQAWVVRTTHETELTNQEISDFCMPKSRCLLQDIQCLSQFTQKIRARWVFEARVHFYIYIFFNVTVRKRSNDIPLVQLDVIDGNRGERDAQRGELDDGGVRFPIVRLMPLAATLGDDTSFSSRVLESEDTHTQQCWKLREQGW